MMINALQAAEREKNRGPTFGRVMGRPPWLTDVKARRRKRKWP
jgi:hypothetical protein